MTDHSSIPDENPPPVSKSARKREAEQIQSIGKRLTELKPEHLHQLTLGEPLKNAIADYQRFKSREAKRRQLQFIGRVMRNEDIPDITRQLENLTGQSAAAQYRFQQLEQWRNRMLSDDSGLTEFIDTYPQVDRQQLRQVVKAARRAVGSPKQAQTARALFRFLRDVSDSDNLPT